MNNFTADVLSKLMDDLMAPPILRPEDIEVDLDTETGVLTTKLNVTLVDQFRAQPDTLMGYRLLSSPALTVRTQVRFPRSKRKRIRKKWAKRSRNWTVRPREDFFIIAESRTILGHPQAISRLRQQFLREAR